VKVIAIAAAVVALILIGAWNAGEMHKRNCVEAGRTGCSVLPWVGGKAKDNSFDFTTAH
jgi:hypothetical protein